MVRGARCVVRSYTIEVLGKKMTYTSKGASHVQKNFIFARSFQVVRQGSANGRRSRTGGWRIVLSKNLTYVNHFFLMIWKK